MKAATYAVECNGTWRVWISLAPIVDFCWWEGREEKFGGWSHNQGVERLVLLTLEMPLGWAVLFRDRFRSDKHMHTWSSREWSKCIEDILQPELKAEGDGNGNVISYSEWLLIGISIWKCEGDRWRLTDRGCKEGVSDDNRMEEGQAFLRSEQRKATNVTSFGDERMEVLKWNSNFRDRSDREEVSFLEERIEDLDLLTRQAEQLVHAVSGRSLLEAELEALLLDQSPELCGHWRRAAQLAHLQGRLSIEAAVGEDARGGAARQGLRQLPLDAGALRAAAAWPPHLGFRRGFAPRRALPRCRRCGSAATARTPCAACGLSGCAYCEACLALGRSRACTLLLRSAATPAVHCTASSDPTVAARRWGLSAAQAGAAGAALAFLAERRQRSAVPSPEHSTVPGSKRPTVLGFKHPAVPGSKRSTVLGFKRPAVPGSKRPAIPGFKRSAVLGFKRPVVPSPERFLLWAVTGAGKTEMIFPLLEAVLGAGGQALVATPRRDVVLELAPRLGRAFPSENLAVLYGGSAERWVGARMTLATTHQLLRFYHSFDLVIIDELDAYPYHNDPMLAYAAGQACKPDGCFIYLSATPPTDMQRQVKSGKLAHARVPVRFHGHPLPVPRHLAADPVRICLKRGALPKKLIQELQISLNRSAQIFLFVSRIAHIEGLLVLLRRRFPSVVIEGTSSQDAARGEKVMAFRDRSISLLVTTTILERGVTVPRSDVFILDADSSLFDEASLVQMAGRAGRSKDDPEGRVFYISPQWSRSQRGAIAQIRTMNRIARQKGYIRKESL
ncbi:helicase-related protein [Paenibacillus sp. NPDC058177]|uniref:helicase-related protein n=1 Tax=Paenibacillus sp. NPDC058177 TaxID=3346369 RepID=UPI0036DCA385